MSRSNNLIFDGLQIVAWIIFIGLCIEGGALLVNFIFSLFKPEIVSRLYEKLDLMELYKANQWAYYSIYSLIISIAILKAYLFYIVVRLMKKMDLSKPFNSYVSDQISLMSYFTLTIGFLGYISRETTRNLMHHGNDLSNLDKFWTDSQAFILMGAVIYVIATIFKKGVEIQNENDLTV